MKVVFKGLPVDFLRGRLDSPKDIRGLPKVDPVGQIIFMSPAGEAYIHLYQVERQIRSDQKVNSEIHGSHTKKQVPDSADLSFRIRRHCEKSHFCGTTMQSRNLPNGIAALSRESAITHNENLDHWRHFLAEDDRALSFVRKGPMHELTRSFAFAETGELLGHLLDGHIIHLPSKPLWHSIERGLAERDHFELWPDNGNPLCTLRSRHICRQGLSKRYAECGPNKIEVLLR